MGKMYTLDGKLLTDTPEVRIGEKIYPVDNRKKTVTRVMALMKDGKSGENLASMDEAAKLLLGASAYREIEAMEVPWPAWQRLFELLMAAVAGEDADEARFPGGGKTAAK